MIQWLSENFINLMLVLVGTGAFVTYYLEKRNRKREAAALIVTQIQEIKDKIMSIADMAADNIIDYIAFYEILDIISDNQWEKYRHLFIKNIDSYSFKTIGQFYEYALSIREQLNFTKRLQQQQYMNIQGMLDNNCNAFIIDCLSTLSNAPSSSNLKELINNIETNNENDDNLKKLILGMLEQFEKANPNQDLTNFWNVYDVRKNIIKNIVNSGAYIQYIPQQIAVTINKQIKKANSLEIIGCSGYEKLKKISKIK